MNAPLSPTGGLDVRRTAAARIAITEEIRERLALQERHGVISQHLHDRWGYSLANAKVLVARESRAITADFQAKDRPTIQAEIVDTLQRTTRLATDDKQFSAVVSAQREIGKLTGSYAPEKIEVQASVGIDLSKLTNEERQRLRELLVRAKRS